MLGSLLVGILTHLFAGLGVSGGARRAAREGYLLLYLLLGLGLGSGLHRLGLRSSILFLLLLIICLGLGFLLRSNHGLLLSHFLLRAPLVSVRVLLLILHLLLAIIVILVVFFLLVFFLLNDTFDFRVPLLFVLVEHVHFFLAYVLGDLVIVEFFFVLVVILLTILLLDLFSLLHLEDLLDLFLRELLLLFSFNHVFFVFVFIVVF